MKMAEFLPLKLYPLTLIVAPVEKGFAYQESKCYDKRANTIVVKVSTM